jgi:hypothetical protein
MPRHRQRVTLQAGPKLSIRRLRMRPFTGRVMPWSYSSGLLVTATIQLGEDAGTMILRYAGREKWLTLEGLPRQFGGVQWFPSVGNGALTSAFQKLPYPLCCLEASASQNEHGGFLRPNDPGLQQPAQGGGYARTGRLDIEARAGQLAPCNLDFLF